MSVGSISSSHDYDVTPNIAYRIDLGGPQANLVGMAKIPLLDGDHHEGSAGTGLVHPDTLDVWNTRAFQRVQQACRANEAALKQVRMRRLLASRAGHDRIGAIIDPLDIYDRLLPCATRIVAGPFSERAFKSSLLWRNPTFKDKLRTCRKRQPSDLALHTFKGLACQATRPIQFGNVIGQRVSRRDIGRRIEFQQ